MIIKNVDLRKANHFLLKINFLRRRSVISRRPTNSMVTGIILLFLLFLTGYGQGDNDPDPAVNLGLLESTIVSGSVLPDSGRGLAADILYDPTIPGFVIKQTGKNMALILTKISVL